MAIRLVFAGQHMYTASYQQQLQFGKYWLWSRLHVMGQFEEDEGEEVSLWGKIKSGATAVADTLAPDSLRRRVKSASSTVISYSGTAIQYAGKAAWVLSTAALVLVLPLAMEVDREQALIEMEQEALKVRRL